MYERKICDKSIYLSRESIFAFEVGGEFNDFGTDQFDDCGSLGDSLFDSLSDDSVNLSSFHFQFFGGLFQCFASFFGENIFTGDFDGKFAFDQEFWKRKNNRGLCRKVRIKRGYVESKNTKGKKWKQMIDN